MSAPAMPSSHSEAGWNDWVDALAPFAAATGLSVSAFDVHANRVLGPYTPSPLARVLASTPLWAEDGPGTRLERELVAKCLASGHRESSSFSNEVSVVASPMMLFDEPRGAVVYGWTFQTFATSLGCERMAAQLGLSGAKFWKDARLESPVPAARMEIYGTLLDTMIAFNTRQVEAVERLHELARMREVFLASVSHELRSPLSAISMRLELLLRGQFELPEAVRQSLAIMKEQVGLESRLIEDLIDAARTRTGQLTMKPQTISLGRVLQDAIAAVQPQAENKQVFMQVRGLDEGAELSLEGDAQRLQQLFWNLLFNAVKFTPAGGLVQVEVRAGTDMHEVEIRDTGRGIEAHALPLIFEAFTKQQQDNAAGLGLGLFIAKHIAERHGGSIRAFSVGPGKGTTFNVSLPAAGYQLAWAKLVSPP